MRTLGRKVGFSLPQLFAVESRPRYLVEL